jgi:soluble lytic murein transglycosylase-like protein
LFLLFALLLPVVGAAMTSDEIESALDHWQPIMNEAAHRFAIPAPWIREVMRLESAGEALQDGQPITSPAGAMGLMQLMPATYAELRDRYGFGSDPYEPHDNIFAGAAYLRELYQRYGWPSLFVAYHAGPGRFEEYLSRGKALPTATRDYFRALLTGGPARNSSPRSTTQLAAIFVALSLANRDRDPMTSGTPDERLFVRLSTAGAAFSMRANGPGSGKTTASVERNP